MPRGRPPKISIPDNLDSQISWEPEVTVESHGSGTNSPFKPYVEQAYQSGKPFGLPVPETEADSYSRHIRGAAEALGYGCKVRKGNPDDNGMVQIAVSVGEKQANKGRPKRSQASSKDTPDTAQDTPNAAPDTPDAAPDTPDAAPDTPDAAPDENPQPGTRTTRKRR